MPAALPLHGGGKQHLPSEQLLLLPNPFVTPWEWCLEAAHPASDLWKENGGNRTARLPASYMEMLFHLEGLAGSASEGSRVPAGTGTVPHSRCDAHRSGSPSGPPCPGSAVPLVPITPPGTLVAPFLLNHCEKHGDSTACTGTHQPHSGCQLCSSWLSLICLYVPPRGIWWGERL